MEEILKSLFLWLVVITCITLPTTITAEPRISYRIVNVSPDDPTGLNVRDNVIEASSLKDTTIVGQLVWNAKGIISSGLEVEIAGSIWREVRLGETSGWVNAKFLEEEVGSNLPKVTPDMLKCSGTEPFWGLNMSIKPASYTGANWIDDQWVEDIKLKKLASHPVVEMGPESWVVTLKRRSSEHYIRMMISRASPMCNDSMSNLLYPYETILLKGKVPRPVYGCCQININR